MIQRGSRCPKTSKQEKAGKTEKTALKKIV